MAYAGPVRQWDLFTADLDHPVGSEQGGSRRPVIVVSNDGFNQAFPVITVMPLTGLEGKRRKVYPFEIVIPAALAGNPADSIIMPYQIRTISKLRLLERMGRLEDVHVRGEIEDRIIEHIGMDLDDEEMDE
jgi:mRNA interferase MazF